MAVGVGLAAAEGILVALLILPTTTTIGFAYAAILTVALMAGVLTVINRGLVASCRCFGGSAAPLSARHVVRNGMLCGVAIAGLLAPSESIPLAGRVTAGLTGAVLGLPLILMDDVIELWAPVRRP